MSAMDMIKSLSSKPEKFTGENFFCWQQQMKFWLTELGLYFVISKREIKTSTSSTDIVQTDATIKHDVYDKDILCHGRILSALADNIYKIFCHTKTSVELWEALELKYGSAEKGLSRYSCEKMIEFQMIDGKSISDQIHEFENIVYDMKLKGIVLPDIMLVAFMISKLPPSWTDFARSLKHKHESFTFDDLLVCLRIEDKHRSSQKHLQNSDSHSKAYLVESSSKPFSKSFKRHGFNKNKFGRKPSFSKNKNNAFNNNNKPKDKNSGNEIFCFVCGRANHLANNCFQRHRQPTSFPKPQANVVTTSAASDSPSNSNTNKDMVFEPRRSKRSKKVKDFGSEFCSFLLEDDPKTYGEATRSIDSPFWKEAIIDEMSSLKNNKTWFLTDLPPGCKSIGCKWVFRKKLRTDGSIEKFKARLVVIGYYH
ncbi:uncharacterized protein LOC114397201 [Glycine soja]|uniref:uncharacterized protein LOC114397201 n=1 Tax=Glycine soja TaxID=3848 RepID=UPI00103926D5|nr:uncharacterized protein LOC114397201 [Glycine soja]